MAGHAHTDASLTRRLLKQDRIPATVTRFIRESAERIAEVLRTFFEAVLSLLLGDSPEDTDTDTEDTPDLDSETLGTLSLVRSALRALFAIVRAAFVAVFVLMWTDGAVIGRGSAIAEEGFDIDPDIEDEATIEQLRENGRRAAEQVEERIIGDLAEALVEAYESGLSIEEIADVLREDVFPDMLSWQARRIAQTEVQSAVNKGRLTALVDAGVPGKRWVAVFHNTRPAHKVAHGQVVPVGEKFEVGGEQARYPGDPSLSPSNRINCQCLLGAVFDLS